MLTNKIFNASALERQVKELIFSSLFLNCLLKIDTYFFSFLYINQLLHPILRSFAQYLFQFRPIVLDSPRMDLYFDSRCKITNF